MDQPNPQNEHGVMLDNFALHDVIQQLLEASVVPICRKLWPTIGPKHLHDHNAFTVAYAEDKDKFVAFHVDDSEVTLNHCLGIDFQGCGVHFKGIRPDSHEEPTPEEIEAIKATRIDFTEDE